MRITRKNRYKPSTNDVSMNFKSAAGTWHDAYRAAKGWLTGSGWLYFSDDEEHWYKVLYCLIAEPERVYRLLGRFTARFVCDPYQYLVSGMEEYDPDDVLENDYAVCHPTYLIIGVGDCTLTVNGNEMSAYITNNLYIDTDRQLAYTTDGEVSNTAVSGDYEELYLKEGTNTISVTSGYTLTVIPNWRCL